MADIYSDLEKAVVRSLRSTLAIYSLQADVIIAKQGAPEPKRSYITVEVIGLEQQGQASKSGMAGFQTQAKEYAAQSYKATVQLNFYGAASPTLSMMVHSQTKTSTKVREAYLRNNISPRTLSAVRVSPQLRDATWVRGYALDMTLGFTVRTVQDVDWADTVTINNSTYPLNNN